jgi:hypothetical protein
MQSFITCIAIISIFILNGRPCLAEININNTNIVDSDFLGAKSSWRGYVGCNLRYFFDEALQSSQSRSDISFIAKPEFSLSWPSGNYFVLSPYYQSDNRDSERRHFDIRELFFSFVGDAYELSFGIEEIFWGVTESQNLVDVINQSDFVANGKQSDKLGQPMINLSVLQKWGTIDFFLLPYFREKTYPGIDGRLRPEIPINTDLVQFESSSENKHVDYALRYSHYIGEFEFGLSYFNGTSRNPEIRISDYSLTDGSTTAPSLYPYYYLMEQVGLDVQYIMGGWLLKGELIYQQNDNRDYSAWTTGFEYTFTGVFNTEADISILAEWLYDDRLESSPSPFENDIMIGARFSLNDLSSSELTIGFIRDIDRDPTVFSIELSRRISDHWKINIDAYWWMAGQEEAIFYPLRRDDFVSFSLSYYF